jgi:hypothetical protein
MKLKLTARLTYANVMVTILAFVVLCGGAAYAAIHLPKNSVGTKQLKKNSVNSAKVKDGTLRKGDFAPNQIPAGARGAEGARGPAGLAGTSHGYQANGSSSSLSGSPYATSVVSLSLPPGNYFAIATVEGDTADGNDSLIQCRLINGNGGAGSEATQRDQFINFPENDNFSLASEFAVTSGQSLNLQCSRSGTSALVRILRANLVAVQISTITGFAG